ncbi:hypothetical protein ACFPA8_21115 [Streptomyces ovatisporus]|uniref:Uncharacterized protein n=1 Tax=Streptomyces ovatisporus TaxID=1128682 RepID=A0ABV9A9S3_9ACTN
MPLPRAEFAFPGPLRDRLVAAVLDGTRTATASLLRAGLGDETFTVDDTTPVVLERFRLVEGLRPR